MLKIIVISLLVLQTTWASECSYIRGNFKSGTPYLKINIEQDSIDWIGLTPNTYAEFIKAYSESKNLDSTVTLLKTRAQLCDDFDRKTRIHFQKTAEIYKGSLQTYNQTLDELKEYSDKIYKKMTDAEGKKYMWGAVGTGVGFLGGILVVVILTIAVK